MTAPPTHHFVLRMSRPPHLLSITSARLLGAGMPRELSSSALHMMWTGHIRIHPPSARRKVLRIGRLTASARSILGAKPEGGFAPAFRDRKPYGVFGDVLVFCDSRSRCNLSDLRGRLTYFSKAKENKMVRTYGLTHINLVVRDAERSLRFYGQVFGVEEYGRADGLVHNADSREWMKLHREAKDPRRVRGIMLAGQAFALLLAVLALMR